MQPYRYSCVCDVCPSVFTKYSSPNIRDLGSDHAASLRVGIEHGDVVAEWREIARHGECRGPGAHTGDALAIAQRGQARQALGDVAFQVRGDTFEPADRHRLGLLRLRLFDAAAPARWFTRPVTGAPEDAGKDVRRPVHHVGIGITPCGDEPDVFGNRGVRRARPLAVDHFVKVVGLADVRGLQRGPPWQAAPA